jgi:molybdenum cofactor guanylyltransferase
MIGVVLCGGQSTRMGVDKGLLLQKELTWVDTAASKLSTLNIPVFVSINKKQENIYSKSVSVAQFIVDDDKISVKGPLLGILSVHKEFPNEDLLVLACDMINMDIMLLGELQEFYKEGLHEAYVYTINNNVEPLCGIYTSKGLNHVLDLHHQKKLAKCSMMYVLECIATNYISLGGTSSKFFANYNSAEDLLKNEFSPQND